MLLEICILFNSTWKYLRPKYQVPYTGTLKLNCKIYTNTYYDLIENIPQYVLFMVLAILPTITML